MRYSILQAFLPAIFNGDYSNLEDKEAKMLSDAVDEGKYYEVSNGNAICANDFFYGDPEYTFDDLLGVMGDCYVYLSGEDAEGFLEHDAPEMVYDQFGMYFDSPITEDDLVAKSEEVYWTGFWTPSLLKSVVGKINRRVMEEFVDRLEGKQ